MEGAKTRTSKKNEQGVALVFTLMLLALLLIMALGFALSSMFSQKAALNAANAAAAGILAQTQLKEIISLIENDEANLENSGLYSHDSGSPAVTDTNMLKDMLTERLPVPGPLDTVDTDKVNWNYIRSRNTEQAIVGRTAFVLIAEGLALDALVDGRAGTAAYPKHSEEFNTETRVGKYVSEINVRAPVPSAASAICDALNWRGTTADNTVPGFDNGRYTGLWSDYNSLFTTLETAVGGALSSAQKTELRGLSLAVFKDKEAFWADLNGDENIGTNEIYKRFDLTRNWDTADNAADLAFVNGKILLDSGSTGAPAQTMEKWDEADSGTASAGLPWLACFGYKDDGTGNWIPDESLKGTFGSVLDRRRQIAANLKDYCDTDSRPTSDVDPASWYGHTGASSPPVFTGNEKTPYINKTGVKIIASSFSTGSPDYNTSAKVEIKPLVGLVNIYGAACSDDLKVRITGTVTVACTINSVDKILNVNPATATDSVIPFDTVIDVNGTGSASPNWPNNDGYSHFQEGTVTSGTTLTVGPNASAANVEIKVTAVSIDKVILYDGTTNTQGYDYVKNLSVAGLPFSALSSSTGADDSKTSWYGLEVNDPRQNLNPGDWVQYSPSSGSAQQVFSLDASDDTLCKPNGDSSNTPAAGSPARAAPKDGDDAEGAVTDPANCRLSTAFIRNAPMESPWELGFIQRGKAWQTVNLKTYVAGKAFRVIAIGGRYYLPGGGEYSAGDANILDQVKMTAAAHSPQKVCLKTPKTASFAALFSKIKYGCAIDGSLTVASLAGLSPVTGTELTPAQAAYFSNKIITKYAATANPDERRTRASVVDVLKLPDASAVPPLTADTDAGQEELIGKIVNLTKIGAKINGFTAIIIAQTIKDAGGNGSDMSMTKNSASGTSSTRPNCRIGQFDATINDINDFRNNIYFDEITAEQKIIVKGYRAITGEVVISSFQYIE